MTRNYKIYFKYLYFSLPHLYLQQNKKGSQNISLLILKDTLYYTSVHLRFSSIFYSNQLIDLFSYELPIRSEKALMRDVTNIPNYSESYLVYNFHNITFQDRLFFFCVNTTSSTSSELNSVAELFPNAS